MAKLNDGPVTELVQIPICIAVDDFLNIFAKELEPILLAQPGIISILTGPTIQAKGEKETHPFVVSLTQWTSMDAHAAFLAGPSAEPFFAKLGPLTMGPPTVEHYHFGRLSPSARKSSFARVIKSTSSSAGRRPPPAYDEHVRTQGQGLGVMGTCVESPSLDAVVLFGGTPRFDPVDAVVANEDVKSVYTVRWERLGLAQGVEHL